MKINGFKKKYIIIALVVLVLVLIFFLDIAIGKERRIKNRLKDLSKTFYTYYYEEKEADSDIDPIEFFSKYTDTGLSIKLRDMKLYLDNRKIENYDSLKICDDDKTIITFYPIAPYGINDRSIKMTLDCKLK